MMSMKLLHHLCINCYGNGISSDLFSGCWANGKFYSLFTACSKGMNWESLNSHIPNRFQTHTTILNYTVPQKIPQILKDLPPPKKKLGMTCDGQAPGPKCPLLGGPVLASRQPATGTGFLWVGKRSFFMMLTVKQWSIKFNKSSVELKIIDLIFLPYLKMNDAWMELWFVLEDIARYW